MQIRQRRSLSRGPDVLRSSFGDQILSCGSDLAHGTAPFFFFCVSFWTLSSRQIPIPSSIRVLRSLQRRMCTLLCRVYRMMNLIDRTSQLSPLKKCGVLARLQCCFFWSKYDLAWPGDKTLGSTLGPGSRNVLFSDLIYESNLDDKYFVRSYWPTQSACTFYEVRSTRFYLSSEIGVYRGPELAKAKKRVSQKKKEKKGKKKASACCGLPRTAEFRLSREAMHEVLI